MQPVQTCSCYESPPGSILDDVPSTCSQCRSLQSVALQAFMAWAY